MNLKEFIAKNEWDGELVLNGVNFDTTCSVVFNHDIMTDKAMELYGSVLNAKLVSIEGRYLYFENAEIKNADEAWEKGKTFLMAIAGYIGETLYEECFQSAD